MKMKNTGPAFNLVLILGIAIFLNGCHNACEKEMVKLKKIARNINNDITEIEEEVVKLASYIEGLYANQDSYAYYNETEYALSENGVLYKPYDDGLSAVFVSGIKPVNEEIRKIVQFTEPLDSAFIRIIDNFPHVVQVYYNDSNSYNRIYPFFNVLNQYEPKVEIPKFNFYYLADNDHNPERKGVWVNTPYVDPAGRGWMISAIAPVYADDKMVGVPGLDVTINTITDLHIKDPYTFLIEENGVIVAASEEIINILQLPQLKNHRYLETIKSNTYRRAAYNLSKHRIKEIRNLFEVVLQQDEHSGHIEISNREFCVISYRIDQLNWKIVRFIQLK